MKTDANIADNYRIIALTNETYEQLLKICKKIEKDYGEKTVLPEEVVAGLIQDYWKNHLGYARVKQ